MRSFSKGVVVFHQCGGRSLCSCAFESIHGIIAIVRQCGLGLCRETTSVSNDIQYLQKKKYDEVPTDLVEFNLCLVICTVRVCVTISDLKKNKQKNYLLVFKITLKFPINHRVI